MGPGQDCPTSLVVLLFSEWLSRDGPGPWSGDALLRSCLILIPHSRWSESGVGVQLGDWGAAGLVGDSAAHQVGTSPYPECAFPGLGSSELGCALYKVTVLS